MLNKGIGSWPARRARRSPTAVAFIDRSWELTYAECDRRVTRLANALRTTGLGPGDRVAYLGKNHVSFPETMFATHAIGAVFVPLNHRLAAPEVDYMLGDSGARVLVYAPECAETVRGLENAVDTVLALSEPQANERDYARFLDAGAETPLDEPVSVDDLALILYTSGTTGRAKGAMLSHGNLQWNCVNMLVDVDVASDEVTLIGAPLFHVAALGQTLLPTYLKGGTSVLMPSWDVDECYDLIARYRVTWFFGVTAMFAGLANSPRFAGADLSSLRTLMSGGAPIPESLIHAYQERGLVFCQGYGLTETAPGATFLDADSSVEKAGSAGTPCFFTDVRVVRADLTEARSEEPGEVLIEGPNVTPGYWNDPDATTSSFVDGAWFRSGDIGVLDTHGYLRILDRRTDMYISGGENVYPAEVEAVLAENSAVAECAVVGVPDQRWGQVGMAYVVPRPGTDIDAEGLRGFLADNLAKYKVPARVDVVADLPRTASGKVRKNQLRSRT